MRETAYYKTLTNWLDKIANYFHSRSSNGRTEGFNHGLRSTPGQAHRLGHGELEASEERYFIFRRLFLTVEFRPNYRAQLASERTKRLWLASGRPVGLIDLIS